MAHFTKKMGGGAGLTTHLSAGFAFIFFLTLVVLLAPQDVRAQAPAAPTDLTAVGGAATVGLLWTKPGGTITGYEILYGKTGNTGSASWAAIPGSDANTVTHIVPGLDEISHTGSRSVRLMGPLKVLPQTG